MNFNYEKAWVELAKPAVEALPQDVRDLVNLVSEIVVWGQAENLDVPWPEDNALKLKFAEIPEETLAQATRAVYFFGHWAPMGHDLQKNGTYWKFSNLADQMLCEKIGLPRVRNDKGQFPRSVHEGCLRAGWSAPWIWTWTDVGFATKANWDRLVAVPRPEILLTNNDGFQQWEAYVAEVKAACGDAEFHRWNTERFMEGK